MSDNAYMSYAREFGRDVANLLAVRGVINCEAGVVDDLVVVVTWSEICAGVDRQHLNLGYNRDIVQELVHSVCLNSRYKSSFNPQTMILTVTYRVKPVPTAFSSLTALRNSLPQT